MAGFLQGGGVGKSLAEWMIHGEPEADVYGMDVLDMVNLLKIKNLLNKRLISFILVALS